MGGADIAAAEGSGSGFGGGAEGAEDRVAEPLIESVESAVFGTDCADADVAQAITVTIANKLPMPAAGRTLMCL